MQPYTIAVPQPTLDRIRHRLADTVLTYAPDNDQDWRYGTDLTYLRDFIGHWLHAYDWRATERQLNGQEQYRCRIDGIDIHFIRVRRPNGPPRPTLVLTHGWPGSSHEFHLAAERLAFPEKFGNDAALGFDLVIPSLPGYGFSGRPRNPIGLRQVATLWRSLLVEQLGIDRFGLQGGDMGSAVSAWLANDSPRHVAALHLNLCVPPPRSPMPPDEQAWRDTMLHHILADGSYWLQQATRPQTIALALADNPAGYAAWVLEKFHGWGDTRRSIDDRYGRDWLITNLMLHLVNDANTSMIWMYRGSAADQAQGDQFHVKIPTAAAVFAHDWLPFPPRAVAERYFAITRWTELPAGGHFAALQEPEAFSTDVAAFFNEYLR